MFVVHRAGSVSKINDLGMWAKEPFSCQQVYSQVSEWISDEVVHDSSDTYSVKQFRTCVNATIGRPRGCAGAKERLFSYLWVKQNRTFLEAREYCHNMSGKLFDDFDGQISTIEFLLIHMLPVHAFWIGIELASDWGTSWITEDKQAMNNVVPQSRDSPSTDDDRFLSIDHVYSPAQQTPMNVFFRRNENETLPSVCYRIEILANF